MHRLELISHAILVNLIAALALLPTANPSETTLDRNPAPAIALKERSLGGCTAFVKRDTLFVVGNEIANVIDIQGTEGGVQVTCDGASASFARTGALIVEAGDGNDEINTDNNNGLLGGIAISVFAGNGDDLWHWQYEILPFLEQDSLYDGGPGNNRLVISTTLRADQCDVRRGEAPDTVEVRVIDLATGMVTGNVMASAVQSTLIKLGAGNDILSQFGAVRTVLSVFGEEGDDEVTIFSLNEPVTPGADSNQGRLDGGAGHDKFTYKGAGFSEHCEIAGVPDLTIPDPELRVMDMATGFQLAHVQFLRVEDMLLDASGGDDAVDVQWDAALMSALSMVQVDLGKGNNTMSVNLLPVLTMPETEGVQTVRFDVVSGSGSDQVTFNHSAGNWFDVFFTADVGKGDDRWSAMLVPPPDDGLSGPEGVRSLQFDVAAGSGNDSVAIHNRATEELFIATLAADFGRGNDDFEATGVIGLSLWPGLGFDTARVTRNLLPFVTAFEIIEAVGGS